MNSDTETSALPSVDVVTRSLHARSTKSDHTDSLLRALDALVYLNLGAIYLGDNLTFLLLLRCCVHTLYVQVRSTPLPNATQLAAVALATLSCAITHLLHTAPDAKHGVQYHYGGLIIDFVGEKPGKWSLFMLDIAVMGIQLIILAISNEKFGSGYDERPAQTLEAEEEGRRTSQDGDHVETEDGIEMQSLLPNGAAEDGSSAKGNVADNEDDDMVVVSLKKSLKAILQRNRTAAAAVASGMDTSPRSGMAGVFATLAASRPRPL